LPQLLVHQQHEHHHNEYNSALDYNPSDNDNDNEHHAADFPANPLDASATEHDDIDYDAAGAAECSDSNHHRTSSISQHAGQRR
jgi:hypothetical protein